MAVYLYMPSSSNKHNPYYCEECVSRGCSCNYHHANLKDFQPPLESGEIPEGIEGKDWKWVEREATEHSAAISKEDGLFVYLDENGREYPCCEYMYDEEGFDTEYSDSFLKFLVDNELEKFKTVNSVHVDMQEHFNVAVDTVIKELKIEDEEVHLMVKRIKSLY